MELHKLPRNCKQLLGLEAEVYGYTGREEDRWTKLQYNRARYYHPSTARWMSQDPLGFSAGDTNLYRYVSGNPVNYKDPSGLFGQAFFTGVIGAVVNATIYRAAVQGARSPTPSPRAFPSPFRPCAPSIASPLPPPAHSPRPSQTGPDRTTRPATPAVPRTPGASDYA
jgi:RHS repeat-associated protein